MCDFVHVFHEVPFDMCCKLSNKRYYRVKHFLGLMLSFAFIFVFRFSIVCCMKRLCNADLTDLGDTDCLATVALY